MNAAVAAVEAWLAGERPRLLEALFALLAIPSVSTDPAYAPDMQAAATLLAERLRRIGLADVQLLAAGGHPAVFGAWTGAEGAPTLLIYGHYDVQPPAPLAAWQSPPFTPTIRDGRIYARGASDDKSPLWIALAALQGWLTVHGRLPVNVKVLLEGEEEIGSRTLQALLRAHAGLLAADVLISADGGRWREDLASVNTNSRGIIAFELAVRTAARDLHSGRFGGPVGNAALVLARLLATLHDAEGRIAVARFTDGLRPPTAAERAGMAALPFDEAAFFADVGARPGALEPGVGLLEALWLRPTIEVNGLSGGYSGPGGKTVIPAEAQAKLSCRLGPGQDPAAAGAALVAHLKARVPSWAELTIAQTEPGTPAYAVPDDDPFLAVVEQVIAEVHGARPVHVGIGGTLPVSAMAKQALGLETVALSYAVADENIHAPNEFFRLASFDQGLQAWARFLAAAANVPTSLGGAR
jgi:acetylornithine deacetylase/succinyl-diaminopimelate desuccinylase-like protein